MRGADRFRARCAALALVAALAACGGRIPPPPDDPEATARTEFAETAEARVRALVAARRAPGIAVALVENGRVRWTGGVGRADLLHRARMRSSTVFPVGELAFPLTAWGVMRLAEQGKLDLDAGPLPARRLLAHTSGLGEAEEERRLQALVERVTGELFADYMRREVFQPLELRSTAFGWRHDFGKRFATGYDEHRQPLVSDGGERGVPLYSTAEDLARWAIATGPGLRAQAVRGTVLSAEAARNLLLPVPGTHGERGWASLGYRVDTLSNGVWFVSAGGAPAGWTAWLAVLPERGSGIVVLVNRANAWDVVRDLYCPWAEATAGGQPEYLCRAGVP